jgi:hypothetical protein
MMRYVKIDYRLQIIEYETTRIENRKLRCITPVPRLARESMKRFFPLASGTPPYWRSTPFGYFTSFLAKYLKKVLRNGSLPIPHPRAVASIAERAAREEREGTHSARLIEGFCEA